MNIEKITYQNKPLVESEVLELLKEYGVVKIPEFLSSSINQALVEEFKKILQSPDDSSKKETPYSNGQCVRITREKLSPSAFPVTSEVFSSSFMESFKTNYLKKESILNEEIFLVKDVVGSKHVANDMHFDVAPTLKFFIYLNDTTEKNGAFTCVPGSHIKTKEIRRKKKDQISLKNREITRELDYKKEDVIPVEGEAGTLIIFTSETFHKAGTVSEGKRYVMRGHSRLPEYQRNNSLKMKIKSLLGI